MPSLSKITDIANPNGFAQSRAFPDSGGLTEAEIARSLKAYNLEPISLKIDDSTGGPEKWLASIRRNIYAYIGNDIPVLLGGTLYRDNREGPSTRLGDHIVCVLGYELDDKLEVPSSIDSKYRADRISMIYAHDDRLGQYAEAQLSIEKFKGEIPDNANTDDEKVPITACITLKLHGTGQVEHLYIDMVQLGLYHKVRMQYSEAESVIDALRTSYQLYAKPLAGDVDALPDDFETFEWSISLCSNKHLKATVTQSIDSGEYNFSSSWGSIREFLSSDMPRYIWRCRVFQEHHVVAEILLDATEAPQGSRVMGHIGYRSNWTEFFTAYFQFLEESQQTDRFLGTPEDRAQFIQQLPGLRHLLRFASKQKNYQWDQLYSPIQYARRALKYGESNTGGDILRKDQPLTIRDGLLPPSKDQFDTDKKYIWIVTGENHLIIGEDIEPADGGEDSFFYGHPTLNANKPARIGGELLWNLDTKQWQINNFSRSYPRYGQSSQKYLNNIIDLFFNKITDMNVSVSQTLR